MSQENVEIMRLSIAAYERGDWDEATAHLAPDVIWEVGQELPARGPAAVRDMWTRWNDGWERLDMITDEIIDAGDKVFVAMHHYRGRGRLSGVAQGRLRDTGRSARSRGTLGVARPQRTRNPRRGGGFSMRPGRLELPVFAVSADVGLLRVWLSRATMARLRQQVRTTSCRPVIGRSFANPFAPRGRTLGVSASHDQRLLLVASAVRAGPSGRGRCTPGEDEPRT